ncbi:MAG: hypothetical protein KC503_08540 [Myxococcales bacterium]|nr:hypothetical protein [Myxococcales bacterium]
MMTTLLVVASTRTASAQLRGPGLPALAVASKKLVPGLWVRYAIVNTGASQAMLVYIAALERKGDAQWFEMSITGGQRRTLLMRTLVKGLGGKDPSKVKVVEAIVQPPGQRPLRLPSEAANKQRPPVQAASNLSRGHGAKVTRNVRVQVAGGAFTTTHFRRRVGGHEEQTWMSAALGAWPLVKYQLGTLSIELVAHGKSASTRIQGEPVKLDKRLLKQLGGAP